jgi:hypothetical protein
MSEALIMACSDRKRPFSGPAVLVYDGPLFRILRQNLPRVELFILSARYGLIPAARRITPYDVTMKQPEITVPQVGEQWYELNLSARPNVYVCMSQLYADFLARVTAEYTTYERIFRIGEPELPSGQLGAVLKKWCLKKQGPTPEWIRLCLNENGG